MRYFAFVDKILFCLFWVGVFALVSCEDKVAVVERTDVEDDDYIEPSIEQFRAPVEFRIDYQKARNFNKASEALVLMGQQWAEEMAQADIEDRLNMAAIYEKAQDDLIRKFGLSGKEEFKWIQTIALQEPSNREVFARAGVWIKY